MLAPPFRESPWLLKTASPAFKGMGTDGGTVLGKYFNNIAEDLKNKHRGKMLEQVLGWIGALHGYFSSSTGGGVRHGTDLRERIAVPPHEARLVCNLIRSYITCLMMEHERLSRGECGSQCVRCSGQRLVLLRPSAQILCYRSDPLQFAWLSHHRRDRQGLGASL